MIAADFTKGRVTIGELHNLPNRWISHFYHESYVRSEAAKKNPDGPEAKELQGQAMADALTGQI